MKRKALIIGALPLPFDGPWVQVEDMDEWDVRMDHEYHDGVMIEHGDSKRVRARILEKIPGVPHVSVWLEGKNNARRSEGTGGN